MSQTALRRHYHTFKTLPCWVISKMTSPKSHGHHHSVASPPQTRLCTTSWSRHHTSTPSYTRLLEEALSSNIMKTIRTSSHKRITNDSPDKTKHFDTMKQKGFRFNLKDYLITFIQYLAVVLMSNWFNFYLVSRRNK